MATYCMEQGQGSVRATESGQEHLQLAVVRKKSYATNLTFLAFSFVVCFILLFCFIFSANMCPELRDIAKGSVEVSGTTVGSRATYRCNSGYTLVGNKVRTCQSNRQWSGREPSCKGRFKIKMYIRFFLLYVHHLL